MKNILAIVSGILLMSFPSFAGQWVCSFGDAGKEIVRISMQGNEVGEFTSKASVTVAGMGGGNYSIIEDQPGQNEFIRSIIGAEDPRSKMRLRIMQAQISPSQYEAYTLLMNMPIQRELVGFCQFQP